MKYLLILIFSVPAFANSFMSKNLMAEFKQQIKSKISGKIKESNMKMDYSYPGKFKIDAEGKNKFYFISNGSTSWYYRPSFIEGEKGEVTIQSVSKLKFLRLFDALYKGEKKAGYFTVKKFEKKREYSFSKKIQKEISVEKVVFISDHQISTIFDARELKVIKTDKNVITFKVKKMIKASGFKANNFEFKIPKNTKVVKE